MIEIDKVAGWNISRFSFVFLQNIEDIDPNQVKMFLHFISDGAGNTNENGESFPVTVDVNPEILSKEDTQQYFTHAPCKDESILIWVTVTLI